MNVTKNEIKDRQLHIEDYLQMVSAEQREYAKVSKEPKVPIYSRITENNDIITDFQTDKQMEKILQSNNLNEAYKKVKSNKGAGGVDGMGVDELLSFLKDNQKRLVQKLRDGKYKPTPVRRVEIPKETKGEIRKGNPYDNACIESFHSVMKKEEIYLHTYQDFEECRKALFEYIESWYNRQRIHSALGYKTPQQVENEAIQAA